MYPAKTRYKTRKGMMKEQEEQNGPFIRAGDKMIRMIALLSKHVDEGGALKGYYEELSEHYLIEINVNNVEITVRMRDTTIKNSQGGHYIVINISYMYKAKKMNRQAMAFPFHSFWEGDDYKYDLNEWDYGERLISLIVNLGLCLRRPTAKLEREEETSNQSKNSESSVKEKLLEKMAHYKLLRDSVFPDEPIRKSFQQLLEALSLVLNDYESIENIEEMHMLHRMINSEVHNLLNLYNKLSEFKQKQHERRYILVLDGMTEQVRVMLRKEEAYTEKELEKQFKLMENRYMEKQTQ